MRFLVVSMNKPRFEVTKRLGFVQSSGKWCSIHTDQIKYSLFALTFHKAETKCCWLTISHTSCLKYHFRKNHWTGVLILHRTWHQITICAINSCISDVCRYVCSGNIVHHWLHHLNIAWSLHGESTCFYWISKNQVVIELYEQMYTSRYEKNIVNVLK